MSYLRRSDTRGTADFGWLQSRHSFSFGSWYDPRYLGESVLRVINDDQVQGGGGFGTHSHKDMEIISYVVRGAMEHRDSMGHVQRIEAGEFQIMSAGTGVSHSEYNASETDTLNFLQIWIYPNRKGLAPSYQQKRFAASDNDPEGRQLIYSPDGRDGSLTIQQDVEIHLLRPQIQQFQALKALRLKAQPSRVLYLHLIKGRCELISEDARSDEAPQACNALQRSEVLEAGDAYYLDDDRQLELRALEAFEALLFDLPRQQG